MSERNVTTPNSLSLKWSLRVVSKTRGMSKYSRRTKDSKRRFKSSRNSVIMIDAKGMKSVRAKWKLTTKNLSYASVSSAPNESPL